MPESYASAKAVEQAISSAARSAPRSTHQAIADLYYDRFLCRIFSETHSHWTLKGGLGMLARVADARATNDADLLHDQGTLQDALADLNRRASLDLDDHFRFIPIGAPTQILDDDGQSFRDGYRVRYDTYIGGARKSTPIKVDLVVGHSLSDAVTTQDPNNRLHLPKLITYPYRLYAVEAQIADKVCATLATYAGGQPSTRAKDLIDLVILATIEPVDAKRLASAINSELRRRQLPISTTFTAPSTFQKVYENLAKDTPACRDYASYALAMTLMDSFLNPIMSGNVTSGTWQRVHWTST